MGNVRLIVEEAGKEPREMEIFGEVTTFGRVKDNSVSFSSDTNVSRYHAQIVQRGAEFYVSDFGSSNGTTVNGSPLSGERLLHHGDKINLGGGESNIIFLSETAQTADEADEYAPGFSVPSTSTQTASAPPTVKQYAADVNSGGSFKRRGDYFRGWRSALFLVGRGGRLYAGGRRAKTGKRRDFNGSNRSTGQRQKRQMH
jgi:hypothetical protein